MITVAVRSAATLPQTVPFMLEKRIGSTTYVVSVRFSGESRETAKDKLLRVIEREVSQFA